MPLAFPPFLKGGLTPPPPLDARIPNGKGTYLPPQNRTDGCNLLPPKRETCLLARINIGDSLWLTPRTPDISSVHKGKVSLLAATKILKSFTARCHASLDLDFDHKDTTSHNPRARETTPGISPAACIQSFSSKNGWLVRFPNDDSDS